MAWPFSNVVAPNVDSGFASPGAAGANTFGAVPNSPAGAQWLLGAHFDNTTGAQATVSIKDVNGVAIVTNLAIPANSLVILEWPFLPCVGALQWASSLAAGVNAKLWGYF
jgi:hypothetical protein